MKKAVTIKLGSVELHIVGNYTKPEKESDDKIVPASPAEWDTCEILWRSNDVTDLLGDTLSDEQKQNIDKLCIEKII